jgi:hypothetical protein
MRVVGGSLGNFRCFNQVAEGITEVVRGLEVRQAAFLDAATELELMSKGLEMAASAVKKAIEEANRE